MAHDLRVKISTIGFQGRRPESNKGAGLCQSGFRKINVVRNHSCVLLRVRRDFILDNEKLNVLIYFLALFYWIPHNCGTILVVTFIHLKR